MEIDEVADALERTLASVGSTISPEALRRAAEATAGWPYVLQVVGHFMLERAGGPGSHVTEADVAASLPEISARVGKALLTTTWNRLSRRDREIVFALATLETDVIRCADARNALGMSSDQFTVYRSRLINQNLVVPAGHGLLRFTLPFIAEWVRQRALADDLVVGEMISGSSVAPPNGPELAARAAEAIERHRQEKPRCNHIGTRSGRECIRPLGHNGPHRYT